MGEIWYVIFTETSWDGMFGSSKENLAEGMFIFRGRGGDGEIRKKGFSFFSKGVPVGFLKI